MGMDYTVTIRYLTFPSEFLQKLVQTADPDHCGVAATLTCHFSHGAPWEIFVITYELPVLADVEGRTGRFHIPTSFNGDRLATMEAVYKDGRNAGPQDWTSYKEFGSAFSPLYDREVIEITPAFFKETKDGEILLRFHFWSGAIIEYSLEKRGATVVGRSL